MDHTTPAPAALPASDVSHSVGLAGLLGLFAWVLVARSWPEIATAFDLPGPRARMDGPYAALCTILFAGLPMVLVTLLVEKAHRRPSTGIDWHTLRPRGAALEFTITKLAGLWATWGLIAGFYMVARWYWSGQYIFAMDVLGAAALPMFVLSVPYVFWLDRRMIDPRDGSWHFGAMLIGREAYEPEQVKIHLRAWAVKAFFCAFMISILPMGFAHVVNMDLASLAGNPVATSMFLIEILFLIDVHCAMVGYLLTMKPLDAHIRSANPHLAGWLAALICYPPFALMVTNGPLDYHQNLADWAFWFEGQTALLWIWGGLLVLLTGIYAWATVIYGIRFSNLTYRGVITNGPYRFTRHPAYLSKNLFWWLSTPPLIATSSTLTDVVRNTAMLGLVSATYYWRARTEERHLLAEDAKYREYHAWMEQNGVITRKVSALLAMLKARRAHLRVEG